VIGPDATIVADFMLHRFSGLMENLRVYPEQMRKNLELLGGVVNSQRSLLEPFSNLWPTVWPRGSTQVHPIPSPRPSPEGRGEIAAGKWAQRYPRAFRLFSMRACTSPTSSASVVPVIRS